MAGIGFNPGHLGTPQENDCRSCHSGLFERQFIHAVMEDECVNCHTPVNPIHPQDGVKGFTLAERIPDLCYLCHETKNVLKRVHYPVEEGECLACHNAHGSDHSSLLIASFPEAYYVPGTPDRYELCFLCHDSDLLVLEKTSSVTNFRNGEQNLHHLHLTGDRGRSCLLCHGAHATGNPHLILTEVPWGGWTMKMNFTRTETGGSCFPGCHGELSYSRTLP